MKNPEEQTVTNTTLQALKKGSPYARETVCTQYKDKIRFYIFSFVKSVEITDEIAQEVCAKMWEYREDIRLKTFDSFLLTLCNDLIYQKLSSIFGNVSAREELWKKIQASRY